jgi:aspartate carbamoyltransferase catalytic subunit
MYSLWGIRDLDREQIEHLLKPLPMGTQVIKPAKVALLMMEDSTRTWGSFIVAALDIGADHLHLTPDRSSMKKGETVLDTFRNLSWMGVRAFIIRTSENGLPERLSNEGLQVVNAGDGNNEHPTQALLDARTMLDQFGDLTGLRVLIAGDIRRSRVARSNAYLLSKLGAEVLFAGPHRSQFPEQGRPIDFHEGVKGADVIMMLRWQKERVKKGGSWIDPDAIRQFALTDEVLDTAPAHAMVMHPGPINYGSELTEAIARGPRSLVAKQVANGVVVRKRVLYEILSGE